MDALLDAAPSGVRSQILDRIATVDGVLEVERVRIRKSGNHYFADVRSAWRATLRSSAPSSST